QHPLLINLAAADVKKEGPSLDLPIAIGVLRGTNFIQTDRHKHFLIAGELALDGRVRKIKGGLSLALLAKQKKFKGVILPQENALEAAVVEGIEVYPVSTLSQGVAFLNELLPLDAYQLDGQPYQASPLARRIARDHAHLFRPGPVARRRRAHGSAPRAHAASLGHRTVAGRRRHHPQAGRSLPRASWGPLPRRASRILPLRPGDAPPAA